jgi:hypothetical protein
MEKEREEEAKFLNYVSSLVDEWNKAASVVLERPKKTKTDDNHNI